MEGLQSCGGPSRRGVEEWSGVDVRGVDVRGGGVRGVEAWCRCAWCRGVVSVCVVLRRGVGVRSSDRRALWMDALLTALPHATLSLALPCGRERGGAAR